MRRLLFRQCDANYPFLWEDGKRQRSARWNKDGEGPTQYFADSPEAAWAEFLRHEEIVEPMSAEECIKDFRRILWTIELDVPAPGDGLHAITISDVSRDHLFGSETSYPVCQDFATRLRARGINWLSTPSAAILQETTSGYLVQKAKLVSL